MHTQKNYKIATEEIHHTKKLDAPSGTAITLAEGIIEHSDQEKWILGEEGNEHTIPIVAKREGDVPGTHVISYNSEIDQIENQSRYQFCIELIGLRINTIEMK